MNIAKYIHSCVLLEEAGEYLLFDPGKFSFIESRVTPAMFRDVATVVITHDHPDHLDVDMLQQIIAGRAATVIANAEVAATLKQHGVAATVLEAGTMQCGAFALQAIPAAHEPILDVSLPRSTAFLVNNRVLNPGDSFQPVLYPHAGVELLITPVMAPWLTELAVAAFIAAMRPQHVLPVHDGYAKDFFLKQRYATYRAYCESLHIQFHDDREPGAAFVLA